MQSIIDCKECPLRFALKYDFCPTIPSFGKKPKLMIINGFASNEAHMVDRCLGTQEDLILEKILKDARINKEHVYITNMIKCYTDKINKKNAEKCIDTHLKYEIEWVKPKYILILGIQTGKILINKDIELHKEYLLNNRPTFITYALNFLWMHGKKYTDISTKIFGETYAKAVGNIQGSG